MVKLGLDAAEFTSGLTKSEYQARRFSQSLERGLTNAIKNVAGIIGTLEVGDVFYSNTKAIIEQAAGLNDLADITGASVEELSRLSNQAAIAGTDFNTLQGYVSKLAVAMTKTDDESKDVARAMQFLGVTTRDPAKAFQEIAVKLSQYEDGIGKVALATALWGKQGAQVLPLLKDIADLQDVGATVTKKQADEAENLQKNLARLSVESRGFANVILNDAVPAVNRLIERFNVGAKSAGSFGQALEAALIVNVRPGAVADQLDAVDAAIARTEAHQKKGGFNPLSAFNEETLTSLRAQREIILKARQQRASLNAVYSPDDTNVRDQILARRPVANFTGGGTSKAAKEQISDAERYIKSLRDQVEKTLDLTAAEQVLREVQDGRLEKATRKQIDRALAYAQEIDAEKARKDAAEAARKAEEDAARVRERISQQMTRDIENAQKEAQAMREANEQLREQKEFLEGGQDALDAYTIKKLNKAAAEKEDEAAMLANAGAAQAVIDATREQAAALRERAALVSTLNIGEKMKKEADAINQVATSISDAATRAADGFVAGTASAKDALRSFLDDVEKMARRAALQGLFDKIFGVKQDGISGWDALIKFGIGFASSL